MGANLLRNKCVILAGLSILVLTAIPSVIHAEEGPRYEYIPSYNALNIAENPPCNGSGTDHESEVKYYVSSEPHYFRVDHVKQWGRVMNYGLVREQEWSIDYTKYFKVVNQAYVLQATEGRQSAKGGGGYCATMDSYQIEPGDVTLDNGALVEARTRYDWCYVAGTECVSTFTRYSTHSHYLQD